MKMVRKKMCPSNEGKNIPIGEIAKGWLADHPDASESERSEGLEKIVKSWLIKHGYDGLAGVDCGCGIAGFMPCCSPKLECVAGHWDEKKGIYLPGKKGK
jgi:hypothetical protein